MPRHHTRAGGEEGLVYPAELRSPDLAGEHLYLVPKDDDLHLQFAIRARTTGPDHAAEHRVEESEEHDRRCYIGAGQGDALEKTYPSGRSRKARNLAIRPDCAAIVEVEPIDLIVEGKAVKIGDPKTLRRVLTPTHRSMTGMSRFVMGLSTTPKEPQRPVPLRTMSTRSSRRGHSLSARTNRFVPHAGPLSSKSDGCEGTEGRATDESPQRAARRTSCAETLSIAHAGGASDAYEALCASSSCAVPRSWVRR